MLLQAGGCWLGLRAGREVYIARAVNIFRSPEENATSVYQSGRPESSVGIPFSQVRACLRRGMVSCLLKEEKRKADEDCTSEVTLATYRDLSSCQMA